MNKKIFLCICSILFLVSIGFTEFFSDLNKNIPVIENIEIPTIPTTTQQVSSSGTSTPATTAKNTENTKPSESTTSDTTQNTTSVETTVEASKQKEEVKPDYIIPVNSYKIIKPSLNNENDINLVEWKSNNTSVATVDSGGRVDGISNGTATIIGKLNNKEFKYNVSVTDAKESIYDGFSTCIIANNDVLAKNISNGYSNNLYYIKVNRAQNCVTVYTYDENGDYTIPVRAMVCSVGLNGATVTGDFSIYFKNEWNGLFGDVYGHYVSGFYGNYLFHSVPFYNTSPDTLETEEFNKLGQDASMGCVRMEIADVKWIFDNCSVSTPVIVYDDLNSPGPLGKPETVKITNLSCGWDPTDSNPDNPYFSARPVLYGVSDVTINKGSQFNAFEGVVADDSCGNDISNKITADGNVLINKVGTYKVTYSVEDAMHRITEKTINVNVI